MRLLIIDIDCLRPDHLGCYGYHRNTSPCIDEIAAQGIRFDHVYASDVPCLPSRTALYSGRFGIHTGVVGHGGTAAEMFREGPDRGFASKLNLTSWMRCFRDLGMWTATVSPFGERHSAFHWYANFNEMINPGRRGLELAPEIMEHAERWLRQNGQRDSWVLHVNFWDPHTPYRAPAEYGDPFADSPLPAWLTEKVRAGHWQLPGPHSAQEVIGFSSVVPEGIPWNYPRQPLTIDSMDAVRTMFDGYDTGIRYADDHVGRLRALIAELGIEDEVAIVITGDHGENLGELGVYGDHQTADHFTAHVPWILSWPGLGASSRGARDTGLHYQIDLAATLVELAGGRVPDNWDGVGFSEPLLAGKDAGREYLVLSQAAWTCQRGVRFRDGEQELLLVRSYHDGYHDYPETMLFDLATDAHEQNDLAALEPGLRDRGGALLERWIGEQMVASSQDVDPMWTVVREGGPKHVRDQLPAYLDRLRATGRADAAERLRARHPV